MTQGCVKFSTPLVRGSKSKTQEKREGKGKEHGTEYEKEKGGR